MEQANSPLPPDNPTPSLQSELPESPKPANPYLFPEPTTPNDTSPKLSGSSFQSRTLTPAVEAMPIDPVHLESVPDPNPHLAPTKPQESIPPVEPVIAAPLAAAFVGSDNVAPPVKSTFTPTMPGEKLPKRKFNFKSKPAMAGVSALVLLVGAAAFYIGYWNNPSVIYSQALGNSSKGYDKLITYVDDQSKANYKGSTGTGTFKLKSGDVSSDGNIAFKSDDKNGELTFDVGYAGTRVSADVRLIESSAGASDIYIKASGIKGLGTLLGFSELDAQLAKLDGSWIVIDHTIYDSLTGAAASADAKSMLPPSEAQILDEAQALGRVNKDYLFSNDKNKSVMTVTQKYGFETVDGHKTYHYKVALQKDNVKNYIEAQRAALKSSKLQSWIKDNNYTDTVDMMFDELKSSANSIKSSDTFDMWVDSSQRIIYKLRFADKTNPASNYVDVGLDYKGGDDFPFFFTAQTKDSIFGDSTFKTVVNLNTKQKQTDFKMDFTMGGESGGTFTMKVTFKPTNDVVKIEKPTGAKPLAQVLSELGYGDILSQLQAASAASATSDGTAHGDAQ